MNRILLLALAVFLVSMLAVDASRKKSKPQAHCKKRINKANLPVCRSTSRKPLAIWKRSIKPTTSRKITGRCTKGCDNCNPGYECCSKGRHIRRCQECFPDDCCRPNGCPSGSKEIGVCVTCGVHGKICEQECVVNQQAEIGFLLDGSGSINAADFTRQLDFVKQVAATFPIGPNDVQVGALQFATGAQIEFNLTAFPSDAGLAAFVMAINQLGGFTNIAQALTLARTDLLADGARPGVQKIAFVLTDGNPTTGGPFTDAADMLKNEAIVVAIGVGGGVSNDTLQAIASSSDFVIQVSDFSTLLQMIPDLLSKVCQGINGMGMSLPAECDPACVAPEACLVKVNGSTECKKPPPFSNQH